MAEPKNVGLRRAIMKIIVYSKGVVTCEEIKKNLSAQQFTSFSEEEMMQVINSILVKRENKFEFIIVTREGRPEFGIRATKKFWE
jgi:hypothetical protein